MGARRSPRRTALVVAAWLAVAGVVLGLGWASARRSAPSEPAAPRPSARIVIRANGGARHQASAPAGTSVGGRVTTLNGEPIAGATVCATRDRVSFARGMAGCASTASNGEFVVPLPGPGRWALVASRVGFVTVPGSSVSIRVTTAERTAAGDLLLVPGGKRVTGVVRDQLGGVVEGAWVYGRAEDTGPGSLGPSGVTRSDHDGRYELWTDADTRWVWATATGYVAQGESLGMQGYDVQQDFDLFPTTEIHGVVRGRNTGAPVPGVSVYPVRLWGQDGAGAVALVDPAATSDDQGRFVLRDVWPGWAYAPSVQDARWRGTVNRDLRLRPGEERETTIWVDPAIQVLGRVVDAATGTPCTAGTVSVERSGRAFLAERVGADGSVSLRGLPPGHYDVVVSCEGFASRRFAVDATGDLDQQIWALDPLGHAVVRGHVRSAGGEPVIGAKVTLLHTYGSDMRRTFSDGEGYFEFTLLAPAEVAVEAALRTGAARARTTVTILDPAEVHEIALEFEPLGALDVHVLGPTGAPTVTPYWIRISSPRGHLEYPVNAAGELRLPDLETGELHISLLPASVSTGFVEREVLDEATVAIEEGRVHTVQLTAPVPDEGSIDVRVHTRDGEPANAIRVTVFEATARPTLWNDERFAQIAQALTDEEGEIQFDRLPAAGSYRVVATSAGSSVATTARNGERLQLTLP